VCLSFPQHPMPAARTGYFLILSSPTPSFISLRFPYDWWFFRDLAALQNPNRARRKTLLLCPANYAPRGRSHSTERLPRRIFLPLWWRGSPRPPQLDETKKTAEPSQFSPQPVVLPGTRRLKDYPVILATLSPEW